MNEQKTLHSLRDETCVNCKFSWKSQDHRALPLRMPRICNYDNIVN